eukprot:TRINITY_DN4795_c0_g1_i11.p1 TRINITY_DN4795_c0_g1~~TRINITY_DN4795_c0_g1_i11.p1  ORF type:complete len:718 (-),score=150.62 TRINITY_DN4795_c0_g1_i11:324-2477(-)
MSKFVDGMRVSVRNIKRIDSACQKNSGLQKQTVASQMKRVAAASKDTYTSKHTRARIPPVVKKNENRIGKQIALNPTSKTQSTAMSKTIPEKSVVLKGFSAPQEDAKRGSAKTKIPSNPKISEHAAEKQRTTNKAHPTSKRTLPCASKATNQTSTSKVQCGSLPTKETSNREIAKHKNSQNNHRARSKQTTMNQVYPTSKTHNPPPPKTTLKKTVTNAMQKGTLHSKEVSTKPINPSTSNNSERGAASWRIQLRNSTLYPSRDKSITTTDWETNRRPDPVGCSKGSSNLEKSVRDEHPLTAQRREDQKQRCLKKDNLTVLGKEEEECVTPEKQLMNKDDIVSPNAPARPDHGNLLDAGAKLTYGNEASVKADMRPLAEGKSERETSPVNRQISDTVICPKAPRRVNHWRRFDVHLVCAQIRRKLDFSGLAPSKEDMGDESLIAKEKSEEELEAANKELDLQDSKDEDQTNAEAANKELDLQDSKDEDQTNAGDRKQNLTVFHDDSSNMDFNGDENKKDTHSAFMRGSLQMPSSQSVNNTKEKFERDLQGAKTELLYLQDFKDEGQTNVPDDNQKLVAFHDEQLTTVPKADDNTKGTNNAFMRGSLKMPSNASVITAKEKSERDIEAASKEELNIPDSEDEVKTNTGDGNQNLTAFHSNSITTDSKADANTNETHDALMQSSLEMPARQSIGIAINVLFPHSTKARKFPLKYGLRYFR